MSLRTRSIVWLVGALAWWAVLLPRVIVSFQGRDDAGFAVQWQLRVAWDLARIGDLR